MVNKSPKQLTFHNIPYVRCSVCRAIGQRKRKKIICSSCQQKVFDKNEIFHCQICGGAMYEICSDEHDWEVHWGSARHEDADLDKLSCVKKAHLPTGSQKHLKDPPVATKPTEHMLKKWAKWWPTPTQDHSPGLALKDTGAKRVADFTPTRFCGCGAIIDRGKRECETCTWRRKLAEREGANACATL